MFTAAGILGDFQTEEQQEVELLARSAVPFAVYAIALVKLQHEAE